MESAVACIVRALGARRCCPGGGERLQRWARGGRGAADRLRLQQPALRGEGRAGRGHRSLRRSESAQRSAPRAARGREPQRGSSGSVAQGVLPWGGVKRAIVDRPGVGGFGEGGKDPG